MRHSCLGAATITAVLLAACVHGVSPTLPSPAANTAQVYFSLVTLPPSSNAAIGFSEKAAQADRLWKRRLEPDALAEATAAWQDLLASNPADHRARASLMRAYLFLAEGPLTVGDHQQSIQETLQHALALAEEGLAASCQPLQQRIRNGLPHLAELPTLCGAPSTQWMFWYAVALTDFAITSDISVLLAWQSQIIAIWQDLIARGDPTGDAHAYLGAFYAHAPTFAGGNRALAKAHLEQAMQLQKDVLRTQVWYVEYVLAPLRMRAAMAQRLHQVVQVNVGEAGERLPEQRLAQLRAQQLLEHLDDLL